jgi:hypothetical protein
MPVEMSSGPAAILAVRLLGRWTELARRHVPVGAGCACGPGFAGVQLGDFESQVLDYLRSRHAGVSISGIAPLLAGIAKGESAVPAHERAGLLADLARTLDSFDEVHGRG